MRNASALLSLSINEGGPFPVLEALASGTPVVSSDTGFVREVISNTNGVLLLKNPALSEITQALIYCIDLKSQKYNRSLLEEDHTWPSFSRKLYLL